MKHLDVDPVDSKVPQYKHNWPNRVAISDTTNPPQMSHNTLLTVRFLEGFYRGVIEDSGLTRGDAASLGKWFWTFRMS